MKIVGLSGTNGSGKDTVGQILSEDYGFFIVSATEMLEEELKARRLSFERENKRKVGNEWREKYGHSAIVDKALEIAKSNQAEKVVVGSLRHPAEAKKVKQLGGIVIWVDADPKVRYQRIQSNNRGRVEDNKTYEQFLAEEQQEMHSTGPGSEIAGADVKQLADFFVENNGTRDELAEQISSYLKNF